MGTEWNTRMDRLPGVREQEESADSGAGTFLHKGDQGNEVWDWDGGMGIMGDLVQRRCVCWLSNSSYYFPMDFGMRLLPFHANPKTVRFPLACFPN
jgi:hypothetical protein